MILRRTWLAALVLGAGVTACGAGDGTRTPRPDTGRPDVTVDGGEEDVAIAEDAGEDVAPVDVTPVDVPPPDAGPPDVPPDVPADVPPPRCGMGIDSDGDGLNNDVECAMGSDPFNRDSDRDGLADGVEARYPRVCVATDRARQRRPPPPCMTDAMCMAGERCSGLSSTTADSDMDGVPDGMEDPDYDGVFTPSRGETDPRLFDTDGDGLSDGMSGVAICRPAGLATVNQVGVPNGPIQVGFDPRWGAARRLAGTMMRGVTLLDDATAQVSAAVFTMASVGADVRAEAMRVETAITTATGAAAVLLGRSFTTHEMQPAITSTFRVARATSAGAIRDQTVMPLIGVAPVAGPLVGASAEFLLDVTTVRRTMGATANSTDVIVTVAPRAAYDNNALPTALRAIDLNNTTGVAQNDRGLGYNCQTFRAMGTSTVDFLWTVDTSGSMGPYQMRVGNTATAFFNRLRAAGIDFRVGVITAGSGLPGPNIDSPGFRWIAGSDPNGATRLCEEVTSASLGRCPTSATDTLSPYPYNVGTEEPTAAAVLTHNTFLRRTMMGEANPERRFRPGARIVTFHVTDEPGTNDWGRYFASQTAPDTGMRWGTTTTYDLAAQNNIIAYFRRNNILTFGLVPLMLGTTMPVACSTAPVNVLPRCVIEGNGGAIIPIATATDPEVAAAMNRIVDAVAGATSQFRLDRTPITSTIKVRVRGMDVPRSRAEGFDYDASSNTVVFYGTMFRPRMGDEVVISYRLWQPCPPAGGACRVDAECCSPQVCVEGRCGVPCRPRDAMCASNADCCAPNSCIGGRCIPAPTCAPSGAMCTMDRDCCSPNLCINGRCGMCLPMGGMCTRNTDCCSGTCNAGRCDRPPCRPANGPCTSASDCCSSACIDGLCTPG